MDREALSEIYQLVEGNSAIVANLPHSGLIVPESISAQMLPDFRQALPNSDWHLDRLYAFLPKLDVTVLQATHSRYVVDLNRELREPIFGSFWSAIVPAATAFNQPIYQIEPTLAEIQHRIETYYLPYHAKLTAILQQKIEQFGYVYLIDLHSFLGLIDDEVCLGNQDDKSCSKRFIEIVDRAFSWYYQVVKNKVFKGGYITRHYGSLPNVEALQIEIRYPIYLNSEQLDRPVPPDWNVPEFERAQQQLESIFWAIVKSVSSLK